MPTLPPPDKVIDDLIEQGFLIRLTKCPSSLTRVFVYGIQDQDRIFNKQWGYVDPSLARSSAVIDAGQRLQQSFVYTQRGSRNKIGRKPDRCDVKMVKSSATVSIEFVNLFVPRWLTQPTARTTKGIQKVQQPDLAEVRAKHANRLAHLQDTLLIEKQEKIAELQMMVAACKAELREIKEQLAKNNAAASSSYWRPWPRS